MSPVPPLGFTPLSDTCELVQEDKLSCTVVHMWHTTCPTLHIYHSCPLNLVVYLNCRELTTLRLSIIAMLPCISTTACSFSSTISQHPPAGCDVQFSMLCSSLLCIYVNLSAGEWRGWSLCVKHIMCISLSAASINISVWVVWLNYHNQSSMTSDLWPLTGLRHNHLSRSFWHTYRKWLQPLICTLHSQCGFDLDLQNNVYLYYLYQKI